LVVQQVEERQLQDRWMQKILDEVVPQGRPLTMVVLETKSDILDVQHDKPCERYQRVVKTMDNLGYVGILKLIQGAECGAPL
jgi:hypothetical protein